MRIRINEGITPIARFGGSVVAAEPLHGGKVVVRDRDPFINDTILWPDEYEVVPTARTVIRTEIFLGCGRAVLVRETEFNI